MGFLPFTLVTWGRFLNYVPSSRVPWGKGGPTSHLITGREVMPVLSNRGDC